MQDDIFGLLMLILMLENGGGTENINQMVIMFLLLNSQGRGTSDGSARRLGGANSCRCDSHCDRAEGYTF